FAAALRASGCLVVLDDVVVGSVVEHFVPPSSSASVLVTTHRRQVAQTFRGRALELGGLSPESSRRILSHHVRDPRPACDPQGVAALGEALGGMPRSLHRAGIALQRQRLVEISAYVQRLRDDPRSCEEPEALCVHGTGLLTSFESSRPHASPEAWGLLGALSKFGDRSFSIDQAAAAGGLSSTIEARARLSELVDLYLITPPEQLEPSGPEVQLRLGAHARILACGLREEQPATK
ncbi:MAG: hypothetical protein K0V04_24035, partial [Deltaproteobacteria bacterium]|nr:hypothetical protein [Deltaproteobacteria bacterium]